MTAGTSVASHDRYDTKEAALQAVTAYALALAGGDSSDLELPIAGSTRPLRETINRATLNLRGAFTIAGESAIVTVARYSVNEDGNDVFMGHTDVTLTSVAARNNTAVDRFFSVISPLDLSGAHKYQLRVIVAPTGGATVDLFAWEV